VEKRVDAVQPLDADAALEASDIENLLGSSGTSLGAGDLLIAAIARDLGATLATRNKNDFDKQPIHQLMDIDIVR
jgi:predicted nucleic acid-binding protein